MTTWAIDARGWPFDYRFRVPARAMAKIDAKVFRMYSWKCLAGGRMGDHKLEWFVNFLDAHRGFYPEDVAFSFIWETHLTHDNVNYARYADPPYSKLIKTMHGAPGLRMLAS